MNAQYKRDMNHNYLILPGKNLDTASYQVRILVGNVVPSLLKCRIQGMDGEFLVYYDITSRQSLAMLYEKKKFCSHDLQLLFGGIIKVLEEMAEYLLNPNQLVICPEYIYVDAEKETVQFCCLPGYGKEIPEQIRALTEYLLPKLAHEDEKAVMLGYGIYRKAMEDTFHLERLKEELYGMREKREEFSLEEEKPKMPDLWQEMEQQKRDEPDISWSREEAVGSRPQSSGLRFWMGRILGCAVGAALCLGLAVAGFLGYLPWLNVEAFLGIIIAGGAVGIAVYAVSKRWKKRKEKMPPGEPRHKDEPGEIETIKEPDFSEGADNRQQDVPVTESFGETVLLSAGKTEGPATLVSREPGELATIYLQEEITVIGKLAAAADAVVPLPTVSRIHAKIRKREGNYYLTDLNSRNGTSVNGILMKGDEEYCLEDEDQVDFAQARYVFLK